MKIKIKTFAHIKELCGFEEKELIVSQGISVADVVMELVKRHKGLDGKKDSLLFAINEEYCTQDRHLSDNDVLAIFPPVSGG